MNKKYNSILIFVISFVCFYLATIFSVEYLNIAFIPLFIFIQNKNSKKAYHETFIEKFRESSLLIAIILLIIFFILRLGFKVDKVYYSVFSSLILSIAILRGSISEK